LSKEQSHAEVTNSNIEQYRLSTPEIVDYDKQFMEQLMAYLEQHISDSDLSVEDMAEALCTNRTKLFTKLKSLVGLSPIDFVRHLRIHRAIEMVANSKEPFSQIAYSIGFTDQRYFSRVFKKETGMTPSEYRQQANRS
jgi:AraC-like DNA-binding protein